MRIADLVESQATGTVQVGERALNEILGVMTAGSSTPAVLRLQPNNTILMRHGVLHARAQLPAHIADAWPRVTVRLASVVVAWAVKALIRRPYLQISGRDLSVDLSAVPELGAWRELWPHVRRVSFEVVPGALRIGFAVHITAEATANAAVDEHA